jgi:hypothetical protein
MHSAKVRNVSTDRSSGEFTEKNNYWVKKPMYYFIFEDLDTQAL